MTNDTNLHALYPFLEEGGHVPPTDDAPLMASVERKARESREAGERFFAEQAAPLIDVAHVLAEVFRGGGRLFTMGNGGSSCDAAHLAVEFLHPVTTGRPALAAVNLTADIAMLSAIGNDVGFDHIFARQLEAQARPADALIGFSTSGNSANLTAGFAMAKRIGMATIGFAGGDGGTMARSGSLDHCLVVPVSSIHRVQECHVIAYHILWDLVHTLLAGSRGSRSPA